MVYLESVSINSPQNFEKVLTEMPKARRLLFLKLRRYGKPVLMFLCFSGLVPFRFKEILFYFSGERHDTYVIRDL